MAEDVRGQRLVRRAKQTPRLQDHHHPDRGEQRERPGHPPRQFERCAAHQDHQRRRDCRHHHRVLLREHRQKIRRRGCRVPAAGAAEQSLQHAPQGEHREQRRHDDGALDEVGHPVDRYRVQHEQQRAGQRQPSRARIVEHGAEQAREKTVQQRCCACVQQQVGEPLPQQVLAEQRMDPPEARIGEPAQPEARCRLGVTRLERVLTQVPIVEDERVTQRAPVQGEGQAEQHQRHERDWRARLPRPEGRRGRRRRRGGSRALACAAIFHETRMWCPGPDSNRHGLAA